MSTSVSSVVNHFPSAENGFTTTTSGSVGSGATTVGLNSVAGYTNGETVVMIIDPDNASKQTFTGTVDTSGVQITGVVWTAGTNTTHAVGATVVDYATATHISMVSKGLLVEHNQDGTHGAITATSITTSDLVVSGTSADGWSATGGTHSVGTTYNAGNRSFEIDTSTDLTGIVSEGMRYRVTRDTTPPTQCADLEASSSQYASKSSPAGLSGITSVFSAEAWVKLESYGTMGIVSRNDGNDGWDLRLTSSGQVQVTGRTTSGGFDNAISYQSIPLGRWVHVAGAFTISTSGSTKIHIDGVEVPSAFTNGADTSIGVPSTALEVGSIVGSSFFDGKLADVRVWSDIRTATEIKDNMYGYPSDTTGLVAHFKGDGDWTDSSSNGNDLTASGGAGFATDNPWNATEYGIITAVSASTIQVFCPSGYGIPNETLTAPFYSTQSAPFGFPRDKGLWSVSYLERSGTQKTGPTNGTWYGSDLGSPTITVPIGAWNVGYSAALKADTTATNLALQIASTLSTSSSSESDTELTTYELFEEVEQAWSLHQRDKDISVSAQTDYYLLAKVDTTGVSGGLGFIGSVSATVIKATCAYL